MSFWATIGIRYLRSKKNNQFISIISGFSIIGVAIGVCTLIVVLSVMDGFEETLRDRLTSGSFHILVTKKTGFFSFTKEDRQRLSNLDSRILSIHPVLKTEAILRTGNQVSGVSIHGITDSHIGRIKETLVEEVPKHSGRQAWVGNDLAQELSIFPGDTVALLSPIETEGPLENIPRIRSFFVKGVYESGVLQRDIHVMYALIEDVREFLKKGKNEVNQVEVQVSSFDDTGELSDKIQSLLGATYRVQDWKELNAHLFSSIQLERIVMFLILLMIILVASFNIITSLMMLVSEKRQDISIMRVMGATEKQIGKIFLLQGVIVGKAGTFIGLIVGLMICLLLRNYSFIELPDIFYDRKLPVRISPFYITGIVLSAILVVSIAAWFPARMAAKSSYRKGIFH